MPERTLIIAEAGVNHNGSCERAIELAEIAARAGADVIKFQSFKADLLATGAARKAEYQERLTDAGQSQLEMLRSLELDDESVSAIAKACARAGIVFMSTPFDAESANYLVNKIGVSTIKIGSGDLTNAPLLLHVARLGKPIILSTGMSTLDEVAQALAVIAFGFSRKKEELPTTTDIAALRSDQAMPAGLNDKVTLLHCTTEYPAPPPSVNLKAMVTLREKFGLRVGYSDHSEGIHIPVAAVALGASVIEKHFTLDRSLPGPDHKASLEPDELAAMVSAIREVEIALGDGKKAPTQGEIKNRKAARRSLDAAVMIDKGEVFSESNLAVKRPGTGVSPIHFWDRLGKKAERKYAADEAIDP